MTHSLLISPQELHALRQKQAVVVFDVSFDLTNADAGRQQFESGHIEGARYLHLDKHLSAHDAAHALNGGRHPLPRASDFAQTMRGFGVTPSSQVVVYDRQGVNFCGRAWWMLRELLGHRAVAVLDGGFQAWQAAALPTATGADAEAQKGHPEADFEEKWQIAGVPSRFVAMKTIVTTSQQGAPIIDARPTPRFLGQVEPLDPVAGHIPGAVSRPFADNQVLGADGVARFKSPEQLRAEFTALLGSTFEAPIHHCGSGVSAVPNLIAMELAGFGPQQLYPGGWSEWSRTPGTAVARG
jgi:thiosulfate/3-mercaptopyruvate sulfurtransferase